MWNRKRFLTLAFSAAAIFSLISICKAEESPYPVERFGRSAWFQAHDWLLNVSEYGQAHDWAKDAPGRTSLGVAGVGNGHVFGLIGLRDTQNAILGLMGPTYEMNDEDNNLPDVVFYLMQNGERLELPRQTTRKTRRTGFVLTGETNGALDLQTVTFGWSGDRGGLLRTIVVKNNGKAPAAGLKVRGAINGKISDGHEVGDKFVRWSGRFSRAIWVDASPNPQIAFSLAPGEEKVFYVRVSVENKDAEEEIDATFPNEQAFQAALDETRAFWADWFEGVLTLTASDPKLGDLIDDIAVLIRIQHSAQGAVGTLPHYSGTWSRDGTGTVMHYLEMGKYDEARRQLLYMVEATKLYAFANRYPIDLDISKAPKEFDWDKQTPQKGDDPNLLSIQQLMYYKATGDLEFIDYCYGFIRRNLLGQQKDGLYYPFHRDETFQVFFTTAESDFLENYYSADTTFMAYAAAKGMVEVAKALNKTEDVPLFEAMRDDAKKALVEIYLDKNNGYYLPYFRQSDLKPAGGPFGNINLRPIWLGLTDDDLPALKSNFEYAYKKLRKKTGLFKTTPSGGYFTGMLPGFLLYNMAELGFPGMYRTFDRLVSKDFTPMGEYAESYTPNERPVMIFDVPTLYRSWESGINANAVLHFLTGMKYSEFGAAVELTPTLWEPTSNFAIQNLHAGRSLFELSVDGKANADAEGAQVRTYKLSNTGSQAATVEFHVRVPGKIDAVAVDGSPADAPAKSDDYGNDVASIQRKLAPGEAISITAQFRESSERQEKEK